MDTFILSQIASALVLAEVKYTTPTVQSRGFASVEPLTQENVKCRR